MTDTPGEGRLQRDEHGSRDAQGRLDEMNGGLGPGSYSIT